MHEVFFINTVEQFSYLGIFIFAIFSGYVVPIPEEIILLIVGYMASIGAVHLIPAMIVVVIAFILGDNVLFRLVLKNNKLVTKLIHEVLSLKIISKHKAFLERNVRFTIFFTRFIPFMRFVGPVFAGYLKVKEKTFMTFNTIAIAIYAPIVMFIGYYFQDYFTQLINQIILIRHVAVILIWLIIGFIITRVTDYMFQKSDID
jgi:membrane protein DedA with SNARE-associated domain